MSNPQEITPIQLCIALLFVIVAGVASLRHRLKLERDLLWGTVRAFAQLYLVGYVLKYVFDLENVWVVLALFAFMVFWAAHAVRGRTKEPKVNVLGTVYGSMLVSYVCVTLIVTAAVVQVHPWYKPQYFIPLGGMIVGNSMNAIAISLDRLFSDIRKRRAEIELALCMGATYQEATSEVLRSAIRAGMIPSINSLMTVGLVSLPGMMTGQILAGQSPLSAIRYQIVVMLMITASTSIGSTIVTQLVRKRCFTRWHQIAL